MARDLGKKKLGPTGDVMLHEKLKVKYVGLKLDENEGYHRVFTVHEVQFVRENQRKYYQIVVALKEFDTAMSVDINDAVHYVLGISVLKRTTASVLTMILMPRKITQWCLRRVVFVTVISRKKTRIWHEQGGWRP